MPSSAFPSPSSSQYFGIGVHQGAVDPSTVTSAPPPDVMRHILGVLQGMGVAITEESKFRLRCVRPLRRDSGASDRTTSSEESANSVSFLTSITEPVQCLAVKRHYFPGRWPLVITVPPRSCVFSRDVSLVWCRECRHVNCCADEVFWPCLVCLYWISGYPIR